MLSTSEKIITLRLTDNQVLWKSLHLPPSELGPPVKASNPLRVSLLTADWLNHRPPGHQDKRDPAGIGGSDQDRQSDRQHQRPPRHHQRHADRHQPGSVFNHFMVSIRRKRRVWEATSAAGEHEAVDKRLTLDRSFFPKSALWFAALLTAAVGTRVRLLSRHRERCVIIYLNFWWVNGKRRAALSQEVQQSSKCKWVWSSRQLEQRRSVLSSSAVHAPSGTSAGCITWQLLPDKKEIELYIERSGHVGLAFSSPFNQKYKRHVVRTASSL